MNDKSRTCFFSSVGVCLRVCCAEAALSSTAQSHFVAVSCFLLAAGPALAQLTYNTGVVTPRRRRAHVSVFAEAQGLLTSIHLAICCNNNNRVMIDIVRFRGVTLS